MGIAAVFDIPGNFEALKAVLEDIKVRKVHVTVNLGEVVSGPYFQPNVRSCLSPLRFPPASGTMNANS